jgi:hypothetical protein
LLSLFCSCLLLNVECFNINVPHVSLLMVNCVLLVLGFFLDE